MIKFFPRKLFVFKYCCLLTVFFIAFTNVFGQEGSVPVEISGKVISSNQNPVLIKGATVMVAGTNTGTTTNDKGEFILRNVPRSVILRISHTGYLTKEVQVTDKELVIVLEESPAALDEVVVVGYGTSSRKEFTGAVSSIRVEDAPIANLPNMNPLELLKGNVSGLNIGATNTAGGEPSMIIRGQNSIGGNNNPLIVLDGVIYMGSLSDINPNDIASFDILKDAVSAAVYGSRSANGVIAITTKKGKSGKPLIELNASSGFQRWQNKPVMMKGEEWIKTVNARNKFTEGSTDWMKSGELDNLSKGKETVWLDEATRTGIVQDFQVAVSGAGDNVNYYLSSSYNKNNGIVKGDDFDRISLLGKINAKITKWLEIGVDGGFSKRDYSGIPANIAAAQLMSPYGVMFRDSLNNLEKYPYTQSLINPLWGVDDGTRYNKDLRNNFRLNSYLVVNVPFISGLSYRLNYLINQDKNQSGNFNYETYYVAEGEGLARYSPTVVQGFLTSANGNIDNNSMFSYVVDNILNYKNTFGKHSINATAVATRDLMRYQQENIIGSNFAANGNTILGIRGLHKSTTQRVDLNNSRRANIGYLGRINYAFENKYFLSASYRKDGASVFGANTKWGNFGAVGLAWAVSNENFLKDNEHINNLKLKISWGQNGNQGIEPYGTLSTVANGPSGGLRYEFSNTPGRIFYGLIQSALGNANLGWETTESWNTGFEAALLKNRLFVDLDLYTSKTTDQIFVREIPVMTGFKTIRASMGEVDNKGIELTIRSVNVQKSDFSWSSMITFWKNRNKLVRLYGEDKDGDGKEDDDIANSLFIGKSLSAIYGYEQIGIVQESDTEYMRLTGAEPGSPMYKDLDNVDGISAADRKILGFGKENFRLNLGNTLTYKNFELYALITGIFGGNGFYQKSNTAAYLTRTDRFNDNMTSKSYWTPENKSNTYPSAYYSADGRFLGLQSRGFVRIQDLSLSYSFNQPWVRNQHISSLRVFLSARNIATFTKWEGGDPETGVTVRENTFPVPSIYSAGISIRF
ncbi:MAG TPA: SusC/RagA family TonB-linked outer membrane protein [Niabella sp.]|nr:SusC/RagA family TonB-linked outer membrane protein [Niabella sp.]